MSGPTLIFRVGPLDGARHRGWSNQTGAGGPSRGETLNACAGPDGHCEFGHRGGTMVSDGPPSVPLNVTTVALP